MDDQVKEVMDKYKQNALEYNRKVEQRGFKNHQNRVDSPEEEKHTVAKIMIVLGIVLTFSSAFVLEYSVDTQNIVGIPIMFAVIFGGMALFSMGSTYEYRRNRRRN